MFIIRSQSKGEYKEKKSRFLSFAYAVGSVEETRFYLDKIKKEYFDARHHCFAYRIGVGKDVFTRAHDDREPAHTAGDQILNAIISAELTNILIVVVRYFGGVKLGASNLAMAYKTAALESISNAELDTYIPKSLIHFSYDFSVIGLINKFLKENAFLKEDVSYISANEISIRIPQDDKDKCLSFLKNIYGVTILE